MIVLLVSLLALGPQSTPDQRAPVPDGTSISAVDVSNFDIDRLSPGLRRDIRALVGTPLEQTRLDQLASRIEEERPRRVAAVRRVLDAGGKARVIFIVGERGEEHDQDNVNARYIVERVDLEGVPDEAVSKGLRDDLQALVGQRLYDDQADHLRDRLERELPRYDFSRRIERGTEQGKILGVMAYEAHHKEALHWLRFSSRCAPTPSFIRPRAGAAISISASGGRDIRFTPLLALDDADDLVEEHTGAGLRFETRRLGTRRRGATLEWSWFYTSWRGATAAAVAADAALPRLYDTRQTITPLLSFAITPELSVSAGVGISELEPLAPAAGSRMANAAIGGLDYRRRWNAGDRGEQQVSADAQIRAGTRTLQSDTVYQRHFAQGALRIRSRPPPRRQ